MVFSSTALVMTMKYGDWFTTSMHYGLLFLRDPKEDFLLGSNVFDLHIQRVIYITSEKVEA